MKIRPKAPTRLPKSFYETDPVLSRTIRLAVLQAEVKRLRRDRLADTVHPFFDRVKSPLRTFKIGYYTLGVLTTVIVLLLVSGCATTGSGTLDLKDGGFCLCVDPSSEGWCYKVNDVTVGTKDIIVPQ